VWHGQKAWNGVAILARGREPAEAARGLPGDPDDAQSRYLEATSAACASGACTCRTATRRPGPEVRLQAPLVRAPRGPRRGAGARPDRSVLAGDFNVIPENSTCTTRRVGGRRAVPAGDAGGVPRPTRAGWTDALRHLNPGRRCITFWDYTRGAWRADAGLRIDHLLLNPAAARRLSGAGVDRDVRGWEKTSDHAPTWAELRATG
jgi:exodeoxyribonuclease-3